jgi:transcriptional regulator with XRE-family HTH domain
MAKLFRTDRKVIAEQRLALRYEAERLVTAKTVMKKSALVRVRTRIRARLEELGMTGRELADACGHKDAWISGILSGYQSLAWEDVDAVAEKLGLSPSELIRHDDAVVRELTPREMRLLRHYQHWPNDMQDRWLSMLDFFAASVPDQETAVLLDRVRVLPRSIRRPVLAWLFRLLEEGIPPEALAGVGVPETTEAPTAPDRPPQSPPRKRRSGS